MATAAAAVSPAGQALAALIRVDPAQLVVKEDRIDPQTGQLTRGARTRDPLRMMYAAGHLQKTAWDALEAFRDDLALAAGARIGSTDNAGIRGGFSTPTPPLQQLNALRRLRRVYEAWSRDEADLAVWCIVEHRTLDDYARRVAKRRETVSAVLRDALEVLVKFYRTTSHRE